VRDLAAKAKARVARLEQDAGKLRPWLTTYPTDRPGAKGAIRQSNRTDNARAKMATSTGVMQGYTGVAAVDANHQIIVEAPAHGTGSEQDVLVPVVTALQPPLTDDTYRTADAGSHSEANLQHLAEWKITALIADPDMRKRDERFATQARHQQQPDPLHNKTPVTQTPAVFQPDHFTYEAEARTCVCPAGKSRYRKGKNLVTNGFVSEQFRGRKRDCGPCPWRAQCLRTPATTPVRNVAFFRGPSDPPATNQTALMKTRLDTPEGRAQYAQRFGAVEPVFGNVRYNKGLDRFTLRGRTKVDGQWKLFCLVHNIEKLANTGYAA